MQVAPLLHLKPAGQFPEIIPKDWSFIADEAFLMPTEDRAIFRAGG
jgi:hypothetical protein